MVAACPAPLRVRYHHHPLANKSAAQNEVVADLDDCLVFFTDDDVRIDPGTLEGLANAAGDAGDGAFFGGPIGVDYEHEPPEWLKAFLPGSARGWHGGDTPYDVQEPVFFGCNWAAFSRDVIAVGAFDVRRGPGGTSRGTGNETDMQMRLLESGVRGIYVPSAMVWHYVPRERCTPRWALDRAYRGGVAIGLDHRRDDSKRWFGVPRWIYGEVLRSTLRLPLALAGGREARFRARRRFRYAVGHAQRRSDRQPKPARRRRACFQDRSMSGAASPTRRPRRVRIAFCIDNMNVGGTELNAVRTAELLDRSRYDLRVVSLAGEGPLLARYEAAGVPVKVIRLRNLYGRSAFAAGLELARYLRKERDRHPPRARHVQQRLRIAVGAPGGMRRHREQALVDRDRRAVRYRSRTAWSYVVRAPRARELGAGCAHAGGRGEGANSKDPRRAQLSRRCGFWAA